MYTQAGFPASMRRAMLLALWLSCLCVPSLAQWPFSLPMLPYESSVTAPSLDAATNDLQWITLGDAAVERLNKMLEFNKWCTPLQGKTLLQLLQMLGTEDVPDKCAPAIQRFGGAIYNHALLYLHNISKHKSQTFAKNASPALKAAITSRWGSLGNFQGNVSKLADNFYGSGWLWVIYVPKTKKLEMLTSALQTSPMMGTAKVKGKPILGIDLWEHAYFLKYKAERLNYITAFFNVINWKLVSKLHAKHVAGKTVDVLTPSEIESDYLKG